MHATVAVCAINLNNPMRELYWYCADKTRIEPVSYSQACNYMYAIMQW